MSRVNIIKKVKVDRDFFGDRDSIDATSRDDLADFIVSLKKNHGLGSNTDRARRAEHRTGIRALDIGDFADSESGCATIASPDLSAERQSIRNEMSGCVQALLAELPEDHRTVLILSDTEELKDREIAEVLGLSLEAAKIRLHRARAHLRQRLENHCGFSRSPENILVCDIETANKGLTTAP